ncbi:Abi-alpha family protein [Pseudomonas sp. HLMP]|uniref:Abi-alpha family protein n=1 Tax=Pseudomonas sp. HLMP TaxID=3153767 RepID=UPI0039672F93
MDEQAKALQEVAKTTSQAIEAAREVGGFISKFISGSLEQGLGIFEDKLKYLRWERSIRLAQRAEELMAQAGLTTPSRPVPLKLMLPLLQGATLEEDDDIQDRWAALLVNAANENFDGEIRRSYTVILEQLTSLDARVLDAIYSLSFEDSQHTGVITSDLPDQARIAEDSTTESAPPGREVLLSLSNLARLGCITPALTWGGGESYNRINPTIAGKAFVDACRISPL